MVAVLSILTHMMTNALFVVYRKVIVLTKPPIFNSYDEHGYRQTIVGCRSSRMQDDNLLYNLRTTWKEDLAGYSDSHVINMYDEFAMSDMFGNNDERWLEWVKDYNDL